MYRWSASTLVGEIRHKLTDADAKTFHAFPLTSDAFALYAADANHVYMAEQDTVFRLDNIDAKTFQLLDPGWFFTKDSQRVYFRVCSAAQKRSTNIRGLRISFWKGQKRGISGNRSNSSCRHCFMGTASKGIS